MGGHPEPAVLIYNADCAFCRRWVDRLKRWDRGDAVALLPLTDPRATALSGRDLATLHTAAHVVRSDGAVFSGGAAVRELLGLLPGGFIPRGILHLPGALAVAERVYVWVARRWGPVPR